MSSPDSTSSETGLVRAIGIRQLTAAIVNTTIGAGIFVLPAAIYAGLGAAAPVAYLICAVAMVLIVTTFALAGSRVSLTGGVYAYVEVAIGPYVGFLAGVLQWLTFCLAVSGVASAVMDQMAALAPIVGTPAGRPCVLALILIALATLNVRGVKSGARLIEWLTAAKLLPLLLLVVVGLFFVRPDAVSWPGWPGGHAVGRTVLLLIFAFTGVEVALAPSGEIADTSRTIPRAMFLALAVTTAFYLLIQIVAQGVLGSDLPRYAGAPLAEAANRFLGPFGRLVILLGGIVSMIGYMSGDMLSSPRNLYAFARDGFLPPVIARVHSVRRTPHVAIMAHAVIVLVLASTNSFQSLAVMTNVACLSLYLLCCGAAVELMRRDVQVGGVPFVIPGARFVPFLAGGVIVWMLSSATGIEFEVMGVVLALATVAYWLKQALRAWSRRGTSSPAGPSG